MNRRAYVYGFDDRHSVVRGHLREWLRAAEIPAMWSPLRKGFYVRNDRLADVMARLELGGFDVRVKGCLRDVAPKRHQPATRPVTPSTGANRRPVIKTTVDGQMALLEIEEAS